MRGGLSAASTRNRRTLWVHPQCSSARWFVPNFDTGPRLLCELDSEVLHNTCSVNPCRKMNEVYFSPPDTLSLSFLMDHLGFFDRKGHQVSCGIKNETLRHSILRKGHLKPLRCAEFQGPLHRSGVNRLSLVYKQGIKITA